MTGKGTILIVEDARELAGVLRDYLAREGFKVQILTEGTGVVEWVKRHRPDLVLLDLMLPGLDGMQICKQLRDFSTVPIIIITARIEENDRLSGLESGADDYVCKPFSPREVVARVKAVLRRSGANGEPAQQLVSFDDRKVQATIREIPLALTVVEYHMLRLLAGEPGRVFSRNQLIEQVYQDGRVVSGRTIDSHIKKLRKKIGEVYPEELIHSVYSAGYKFEES